MRLLSSILLAAQAVAALSIGGEKFRVKRESDGLQNIVTYDEHSLLIRGERIFIFSGEFHPYRLPVPGLWLDIFQKVKALGFSAVSFYTHWALFEGEPGVYRADGVFDLEPFFAAASEAGIYLIARPGPYINAESSGGGFPGWLQRNPGILRTRAPSYLDATNNYAAHVGASIAKAQITNGGPVILTQPENEYSQGDAGAPVFFPDPVYMKYVEDQLRNASITVPLILNDAFPHGFFAPGSEINGTAEADVDIYGYDSYPLGFDCANPTTWPAGSIPTFFLADHEAESPSTFNSIDEFQGGSFDPWGGPGFDQCEILLNNEFERVFYKNNFGAGVTLLNIYMIWGGTNWGNLGHEGGYTSYDYGASMSEDRGLSREKYSELKLEANFLRVTPAYLTATAGNLTTGEFATGDIVATPLTGNGSASNFYILRHSNFAQTTASNFTLINIHTSQGTITTIPQLGGSLTLSGRDSKWFVTDYDVGSTTLLYSTAEIFTWKVVGTKTFLIVYGGPNELHELSVISNSTATTVEGTGITTETTNGTTILNWSVSPTRRVVQIGSLFVYILDRNTAYNYWVPDFPRTDVWANFTANIGNTTSVIVEAGYLIRTAGLAGSSLELTGDLNATVPLKVIGAPSNVTTLTFNGKKVDFAKNNVTGELTSTLTFAAPSLEIPELSSLEWKFLDNLPEIQSNYSDALWKPADLKETFNTFQAQLTPTSLFGSDYGFNTGVLIFRGHFKALGTEKTFSIGTIGGFAYGSTVFLDSTFIGSYPGIDAADSHNDTYTLPNLVAGKSYILTVLVDNQGLQENGFAGDDQAKTPRGILNYTLDGQPQTAITWKLTGNLGGEQYIDKVRGPLNEGGLFAERQGFTQPFPPSQNWKSSSPLDGISQAGVAFYTAELPLSLPKGYDVPMSFVIGNTTLANGTGPEDFRVQLWVNGWQFGKYVNSVGPQTTFPVPEGILNYQGTNWVGIELWAQQTTGAALKNFTLVPTAVVQSGYGEIALVDSPRWTARPGAY